MFIVIVFLVNKVDHRNGQHGPMGPNRLQKTSIIFLPALGDVFIFKCINHKNNSSIHEMTSFVNVSYLIIVVWFGGLNESLVSAL